MSVITPLIVFGFMMVYVLGRWSGYSSAISSQQDLLDRSWRQGASSVIMAEIVVAGIVCFVRHGFQYPNRISDQHLIWQHLSAKLSWLERRRLMRAILIRWKESSLRSHSMAQSILEMPAVFSDCKKYRYLLTRQIPGSGVNGPICFIGKNPSTADGTDNDPTIARCVKIAKRHNHSHLVVVNLLAWRETYSEKLANIEDPVGPDCDHYILKAIEASTRIVLMWGVPKGLKKHKDREMSRQQHVMSLLKNRDLECIGKTDTGFPHHVLFSKGLLEPFE